MGNIQFAASYGLTSNVQQRIGNSEWSIVNKEPPIGNTR